MDAYKQLIQQLHDELTEKISPADGDRALAAFNRVLEDAGFDAETASDAQFQVEVEDAGGFPDDEPRRVPPPGAAAAWCAAVEAGRVELCDNAPFVSAEAFGLVDFLGRDWEDGSGFPLPVTRPRLAS